MTSRKFNGEPRTPHTEPVSFYVDAVISAGSAVTSQTCAAFVTVTKPAGTGIYRLTFTDPYQKVLSASAVIIKAAGTFDADIMPVAFTNEATATNLVVDFQVRKSSDGTALDPVSITLQFSLVLRNSTVTL